MDNLPPRLSRLCGKYRLKDRITSGSFGALQTSLPQHFHSHIDTGDLYRANNIITGKDCAVKLEAVDAHVPKLVHEWKVYKHIGSGIGIPHIYWCGTESCYRAIIMTLLGPSLEDLFNTCNRKFSLKTVLQLADQLVSIRQWLMSKLD